MFATVNSLGVQGVAGFAVRVEADVSSGLPQFAIVGLPDSAVKESADRVRSALKNLGFSYPVSRVTVNLAPAHVRKTGPVYDLPIFSCPFVRVRPGAHGGARHGVFGRAFAGRRCARRGQGAFHGAGRKARRACASCLCRQKTPPRQPPQRGVRLPPCALRVT